MNKELYQLLFSSRQSTEEPTKSFLAANLAEIPHKFTAKQEIDMTYGPSHLNIRRKIPKDEIEYTLSDRRKTVITLATYTLPVKLEDR